MYALILAGGKGERLRPITDALPKPMIPLHGRPILWHQVRWLRAWGVTDVLFLVGHLADAIMDYFGDGVGSGVRAHYCRETTPLGRGGALRQGLGFVPTVQPDPVIAINGDVITDADLGELLLDYHRRVDEDAGHLASVLTIPMISPYGILDIDNTGTITGFREKGPLPYRINGGVYVFNPAIREWLPEFGDHEDHTFPLLAEKGLMSAVHSDSFWRSVDSPKDLAEAEAHLAGQAATSHRAAR
jgi:NDP-sugar pyrophosphorylase family protein